MCAVIATAWCFAHERIIFGIVSGYSRRFHVAIYEVTANLIMTMMSNMASQPTAYGGG